MARSREFQDEWRAAAESSPDASAACGATSEAECVNFMNCPVGFDATACLNRSASLNADDRHHQRQYDMLDGAL